MKKIVLGTLLGLFCATAGWSQEGEEPSEAKSERITGHYKVSFGAAKPRFSDKLVDYDLAYKEPAIYPTLYVDYLFFDWYATLGVNFNISYYRDEGKGLIGTNGRDSKTELELVAIPISTSLVAQIVPYAGSFFFIQGWTGYQFEYVQEAKHPKGSQSSDVSSKTDVAAGWNHSNVTGVGLGLKLDFLERAAANSLRYIGFKSVYIMPYAEKTTLIKSEMLDLSRFAYGILFSFESIK
jgi:hypothetical protein